MSQLSFPRINFKGLVTIDVGTGNNDDYSSVLFPPESPFAGQPLRPADSQHVQPDYITPQPGGMTDEEWVNWATHSQTFIVPPKEDELNLATIRRDESRKNLLQGLATFKSGQDKSHVKRIPGEWNYYGGMGMVMQTVQVTSTEKAPNTWDDTFNKAKLTYNNRVGSTGRSTGIMNDVNPESVPCSQIFADFLTLEKDGEALMNAKPHKAVTRRINFQRNVYLNGPNGAGGYFQHAIPAAFLEGQAVWEYMQANADPNKKLIGVICRYYIARNLQPINTFQYPPNSVNDDPGDEWYKAIEEIYTKSSPENKNAGLADLTGTLAPWYEGEMKTVTLGRIMNADGAAQFDLPKDAVANSRNGKFSLAPIVFDVDYDKGLVSLDCIDAFPEAFDVIANSKYNPNLEDTNPKYNFGTVTLVVLAPNGNKLKIQKHEFGAIDYSNPNFVKQGCLVDFTWDTSKEHLTSLIREGNFQLLDKDGNALLTEKEYFIASDQNCIFAEQNQAKGATQDRFINDTNRTCPSDNAGVGIEPEASTFRLMHKGVEITDPTKLPKLEIQVFDTTPNQKVGPLPAVETIAGPIPGDALRLGVNSPGNRLAYFAINDNTLDQYEDINLMTQYYICVRILPNHIDFSKYYVNPKAEEKVGNDSLTFEVMYQEVLRNYYLLYPAMSEIIPLNQKDYWNTADMARRLKARTSLDFWGCHAYMPRTRDLSNSRRELIHAWCNKIIQNGPEK